MLTAKRADLLREWLPTDPKDDDARQEAIRDLLEDRRQLLEDLRWAIKQYNLVLRKIPYPAIQMEDIQRKTEILRRLKEAGYETGE